MRIDETLLFIKVVSIKIITYKMIISTIKFKIKKIA